jgi:carbon monoxide dehydrogenase subunit G
VTTIARSGEFVVERPRDAVAELLADPERVARCLPDAVESVEPRGDDAVSAVVVTGTPAVNTRLRVRLRRTADEDGANGRVVTYEGHGSAARSRVDFSGEFGVVAVEGGVRVDWAGEARVGGLLASLGGGVGRYDGVVAEKIDAAIANVRTEVDA